MAKILATQNEAWGFYGTMRQIGRDPEQAWNEAMRLMPDRTGAQAHEVRTFLDSCQGRHFADTAADVGIEAAITQWLKWTTTRRDERHDGTPAGMPYLTAQIAKATIDAECGA